MIEDLNTTNILLGIMAAVSVVQTLVLIAVVVLALRLYRQTLQTVRQVAPLAANVAALVGTVDGILADVKDVTARVTRQTERVDTAILHTMHSVDKTAGRVLDSVEPRIIRIAGLVRGVTCAIQDLFRGRRSDEAPAISPVSSKMRPAKACRLLCFWRTCC